MVAAPGVGCYGERVKELARLPRTDALLADPRVEALPWIRDLKKKAIAQVLQSLRDQVVAGDKKVVMDHDAVVQSVCACLQHWVEPGPRPVINATGVILHTNVGRAPYGQAAVEAMVASTQCCDLEIDLRSGERGSRYARIRPFMSNLVGAEDVHVVNNGAGALLLACSALAGPPGERIGVALSRGQMVEIGDSFRITTMAAAGGAKIVEVGSTNRTHVRDYAEALEQGPVKPAAILWAHLSNFAQSGFTKHPELEELAALCHEKGVYLIADIGSGSLGREIPGDEPTISEYLASGAHMVTCSGDKLFGGPQAGVLAGRADLMAKIRKHPLARALRPDKTTLAAFHATLREHAREEGAQLRLHQMIRQSLPELRERAKRLSDRLQWSADHIVDSQATIGGGSLPGDLMPSVALCVPESFGRPRFRSVNALARQLRCTPPRVLGRVTAERLYLDLRTVNPKDEDDFVASLQAVQALAQG